MSLRAVDEAVQPPPRRVVAASVTSTAPVTIRPVARHWCDSTIVREPGLRPQAPGAPHRTDCPHPDPSRILIAINVYYRHFTLYASGMAPAGRSRGNNPSSRGPHDGHPFRTQQPLSGCHRRWRRTRPGGSGPACENGLPSVRHRPKRQGHRRGRGRVSECERPASRILGPTRYWCGSSAPASVRPTRTSAFRTTRPHCR